jgi:hypothetical protein
MKATAKQKAAIKKALKSLDKDRVLEGLGRAPNRTSGFPLISEALQSEGFNLRLTDKASKGDEGNCILEVEFNDEPVENMAVSYSWHWKEGIKQYEIIAYIS